MVDKRYNVMYHSIEMGHHEVVLFPPLVVKKAKGGGPMIAIMLIGVCLQAASILLQVLNLLKRSER